MYNQKISTIQLSRKSMVSHLALLAALSLLGLLVAFQAKAQEVEPPEGQEVVVTGRRSPRYRQALVVLHESLAYSHRNIKSALRSNLENIKSVRKTVDYRKCVRSNQNCLETLHEISSGMQSRALMIPRLPEKAKILNDPISAQRMTDEERQFLAGLQSVRSQLYGQPFAYKSEDQPEIAQCLNDFAKWRINLITRARDNDIAKERGTPASAASEAAFRREYKENSLSLFKCYYLEEKFLAEPEKVTGLQIGDFLKRTEAMNRADIRRLQSFQL